MSPRPSRRSARRSSCWAYCSHSRSPGESGGGPGAAASPTRLYETFGGVLLLGLEILVAADLVRTVAVEPTVENVAILGLIVLIRTFLSFSLEIEIEGIPPWRRALAGGSRHLSEAVSRATTAIRIDSRAPCRGSGRRRRVMARGSGPPVDRRARKELLRKGCGPRGGPGDPP